MNLTLFLFTALLLTHLFSNAQEIKSEVKLEEPPKEFLKVIETTGDFRYRYQAVTQGSNQERRVNRLMFRVGQSVQVQDDLKINYRLLTGTSANSGNVTTGDSRAPGAPRQSIGLDHVYAYYFPASEYTFYVGKFPQFFYIPGKNQLILDNDISPEGLGTQINLSLIENVLKSSINLGSFWIREKYDETNGKDSTDSFLNVAQINLNYQINKSFELIFGYGLFNYSAIKDDKPVNFVSGATSAKGNTLDSSGNYRFNYEIAQNFLELKWKENPFTVSLFAEFNQNTAADDLNKSSALGFSIGWKKITFAALKKKVEKDSIMALYTDSDFADGQSDSEGNFFSLAYKFNKSFNLVYSLQKSQQTIASTATDYDRSHVDLNFTF